MHSPIKRTAAFAVHSALRASALTCTLALSALVPTAQATLASGLSAPVDLGEATFRWLGIPIYRAKLMTEGQARFDWNQPLSLRLDYLRDFSRDNLVKSTRAEIGRLSGETEDLPKLMQKITSCYRDVSSGDSYLATSPTPDTVELRLNGKLTCRISHPDVRQRFLGIWLSTESRAPSFSAKLRGQ